MQHLTPTHLNQWLEFLTHKRLDPWALSLEVLTRSGARSHELALVKLDDIDLDRRTLKLTGAKGSNTRTVPIDKGCLTALWANLKRDDSVLAMLNKADVECLKRDLRREFQRSLAECFGIPTPKVKLHGLRASFAMTMYSGLECDILLVKQLLGHKQIASTMHYVHAVNLEEQKPNILRAFTRANLTRRK